MRAAVLALCALPTLPSGEASAVLRVSEPADARSLRSFCGVWNDGCNSFRVVPEGAGDKHVLIEPRKTCVWQGEPYCECFPVGSSFQPWCAPQGCHNAWFDGCNDYTVTSQGYLTRLTGRTCTVVGDRLCKDAPITPPPPPTNTPSSKKKRRRPTRGRGV
jgi:hypothetical protein